MTARSPEARGFTSAPSAAQNSGPAIISGDINADASIFSGSGFEVTGLGDGVYLVDFDQSFDSLASVVLTENYPGWSDFSSPGHDSRDNAVVVAAKRSQFKYITGSSDGVKTDRNCSFIAAGSRSGAVVPPRIFGNVSADGSMSVLAWEKGRSSVLPTSAAGSS